MGSPLCFRGDAFLFTVPGSPDTVPVVAQTARTRQCSHETEAHKKMHLICIAARNDAVFFAYLVATPLHRFKCKKAFSTR